MHPLKQHTCTLRSSTQHFLYAYLCRLSPCVCALVYVWWYAQIECVLGTKKKWFQRLYASGLGLRAIGSGGGVRVMITWLTFLFFLFLFSDWSFDHKLPLSRRPLFTFVVQYIHFMGSVKREFFYVRIEWLINNKCDSSFPVEGKTNYHVIRFPFPARGGVVWPRLNH